MVLGTPTIRGRPALDELLRERHRAVATDDDQAVQIELGEVRQAARRDVMDLDAAVGQS